MPFIPAADTVRVAINYLSETLESATNVLHFRNDIPSINTTQVTALLTALKAWQAASWAPIASADWQTDFYEVRDLTTPDGAIWTDVETIPGTVNSPSLPAQNTIAVSLRSGFAGRSRRGRLFHVGLPEDRVIGSRITVGHASELVTAYQALVTALSSTDWEWVVASFVSNKVPRATALLTPITDVILTDTVVDSMDSRKPDA